jgi:hypothetical protein
MMAEQGHRLALRYQVSKSNYRFEFANLPSLRLAPVTSSLLESFDLVVLDDDALETLATTEKNILEESIHQGLGMILLSNRTSEKDRLRDRFLPLELRKTLKDTAQLSFSTRRYTLPVLTLQTTENPAVYPVLKNGSRVLSAYTYAGFGKVGFQFLQETYRIALEGNTADYASIWSPLLEKIARQKNERFKIQPQHAFPVYPDETLHVEIISNVEEHPALKNDQANVPLTEHVMIDNTWLGKVWAGNPGWHRFSVDSTTAYYFVSESSAWRSLQTANQIRENEKVTVHVTKVSQPEIIGHRKVISNLIFYLIFLFASGFLWLAPKI